MNKRLYLGKWALGCKPPESSLGIWQDMRGDWWAHCWREDYGPLHTADLAEEQLKQICGNNLAVRSEWRIRANAIARLLLRTTLITAALALLMLLIVGF